LDPTYKNLIDFEHLHGVGHGDAESGADNNNSGDAPHFHITIPTFNVHQSVGDWLVDVASDGRVSGYLALGISLPAGVDHVSIDNFDTDGE
jgi:hypothetical protein